MKIPVDVYNPQREKIQEIVGTLSEGKTIIYPTDTVYGLGCLIDKEKALDKIFQIKQRPYSKPLSIACGSIESARKYAHIGKKEEKYMKEKLGQHYTFLLEKKNTLSEKITGKSDKVGLRIIHLPLIQQILEKTRSPIITTSANITGKRATNNISQINQKIIEKADLALDANTFGVGRPSTVVDMESKKIIRK